MSNKKNVAGIGYGRPPSHSRFRKGQTGNPRGRPKGSKNLATQILNAVHETVRITLNGHAVRVTKLQAAIMQLANKAAQGEPRAMTELLNRVGDLQERAEEANGLALNMSETDRVVLLEIYRRMMECKEESANAQ